MKKVVVLDAHSVNPGEFDWNIFLDCVDEVERYDRTSEDEIFERIKDATYVFTCKVPLRSELLEKCSNLKYIGSMATGVNHIDVEFCSRNNIVVTNVPNYSTNAVSELVFAYMFEYFRKVSLHNRRVHSGEWVKSKDFCFYDRRVSEIAGKTLGIFGYGNIGRKVSEIAIVFGMKVLVHTTTKREDTDNIKFVSKEELFKNSLVYDITEKSINKIVKKFNQYIYNLIDLNTNHGAINKFKKSLNHTKSQKLNLKKPMQIK
ncbi:Putative D-isomer specific 2-hydroxyacid dehydrogenase NAD-binding protein [Candidatus Arthromitus sp. SFB-2]|nr:Putative D-isomer specific 2-hydroxyacid dehydrogenase NAD-binding protein [Candidatus Arthromitus sp. SFB-2]